MTIHNSNSARLGSLIAQLGIAGVAIVTAVMNCLFWLSRGDVAAALLTLGAEAVAIGGFVMVLHHWKERRWTAVGALIVTLLSAGWGGLTMTEKLSEEAHERALSDVRGSDAYRQAAADLETASAAYSAVMLERPAAELGPLTTAAKAQEIAQRAQRLEAERDRAQVRVDALTPTPAIDPMSAGRGLGAMLAVLLGLSVFGLRSGKEEQPVAEEPKTEEQGPRKLTASELGKLGAEAKKRKREEAERLRLARNAYMREWRARKKGIVPAGQLAGETWAPLNEQPL